jgi:hypothetical protein
MRNAVDANEEARYAEARLRLAEEAKEAGTKLELCVALLQKLSRCMKGEEVDHTGLGLWRIFCNNLEYAMKCRVITEEQWQAFLEMQDEYGKRGR